MRFKVIAGLLLSGQWRWFRFAGEVFAQHLLLEETKYCHVTLGCVGIENGKHFVCHSAHVTKCQFTFESYMLNILTQYVMKIVIKSYIHLHQSVTLHLS